MRITRKLALLTSAAVAVAVGVGGAAFALGGHPSQSTGVSPAGGFHACIESGNHVKNGALYPDDQWHPLTCTNAVLYDWPSKRAADAAIADLQAQVEKLPALSDPSQHVFANGPYPGATQLQYGDNSTAKWVGDQGATQQNSWVACPAGAVAVGGGFSRADEGPAAEKALQVVTSAPTQIDGGKVVYHPIAGNPDGAYTPNGWLVEGYNNGTTDLIVRPYVICWAASLAPTASR